MGLPPHGHAAGPPPTQGVAGRWYNPLVLGAPQTPPAMPPACCSAERRRPRRPLVQEVDYAPAHARQDPQMLRQRGRDGHHGPDAALECHCVRFVNRQHGRRHRRLPQGVAQPGASPLGGLCPCTRGVCSSCPAQRGWLLVSSVSPDRGATTASLVRAGTGVAV